MTTQMAVMLGDICIVVGALYVDALMIHTIIKWRYRHHGT